MIATQMPHAPGQHTCECNEGFTGNGQRCSPCSACPDGFLLTSLCTSTADTVCTDPCESVPCVAGTCDRETATCVCEDGWIGSACATPDPCSQGLDASGNPGGPWIELVNANDMTPSTVIDGAYWGSRCDAGPTVTPTDFVMWVKMGQVNDYFRVRDTIHAGAPRRRRLGWTSAFAIIVSVRVSHVGGCCAEHQRPRLVLGAHVLYKPHLEQLAKRAIHYAQPLRLTFGRITGPLSCKQYSRRQQDLPLVLGWGRRGGRVLPQCIE
jgi:hypothetical protein